MVWADMVVVDAGMLSTANLTLNDADLRFIVGSRTVRRPGDLATHSLHWNGDAFTDGQITDTITPACHHLEDPQARMTRAEPVWDPASASPALAGRSPTPETAVRDGRTLTAQENRALAVIAGDKPVKSTWFVKTAATGRTLDGKALERALPPRRAQGLPPTSPLVHVPK